MKPIQEGVYGKEGKGLVSQYGLDECVFLKLITFGKAYGSHGGLVLGSKDLKNYLINFQDHLFIQQLYQSIV